MALSLRKNNPYTIGYLINYKEGDQSLERFKLKYKPSINDKIHRITDFDNLWNLAFDFYQDSKLWWVIADINNIEDPFILKMNDNLIIPDIDRIKATIL